MCVCVCVCVCYFGCAILVMKEKVAIFKCHPDRL